MSLHVQRGTPFRFSAITASRASGALLLTLALGACGGGGDDVSYVPLPPTPPTPVAGTRDCLDYDKGPMQVRPKTITIRNNTEGTIYPVVATSNNSVNEWIQACFRSTEPYPTKFVYKLHVNEGKGIPAGSSVTVTLPLYSELSKGDYITWWNGGRVLLADRKERLIDEQEDKKLAATPDGVSCQGDGTACELSTYSSNIQFHEDVYAQLSEYTFGDSIMTPTQPERLLKPENVGYNISYVDHVYLPVAIGPKNNRYIGYSGSKASLGDFRKILTAFRDGPGEGWPVYNLGEVKLPGGYNIFAQRDGHVNPADDLPVKTPGDNPPVLTVQRCIAGQCSDQEKTDLHFGQAVQRMQDLWGSCVAWDGSEAAFVKNPISCPADMQTNMEAVKQFFIQNHKNYLQLYAEGKCTGSTPQKPVFNYWEALTHIYGWVPFNEGCGASANKLKDTSIPGWTHDKIQSMYIHELQYNHLQQKVKDDPTLTFNPYVKLIHEDLDMNAYGFSVDDAVGFMTELGDGLIFTVGGTKGLENETKFGYADGFTLAVGVPSSLDGRINKPLIKKYGACSLGQNANDPDCLNVEQDVTMPGNSQIAGFRLGTVPSYPMRVRFTDMNDNVYNVLVKEKFEACPADKDVLTQCPTNKARIVDVASCSVVNSRGEKHLNSDRWCLGANPNQNRDEQLTKNFISYPAPADLMP
jgi:hypothetical protein